MTTKWIRILNPDMGIDFSMKTEWVNSKTIEKAFYLTGINRRHYNLYCLQIDVS